jgi:hypothetical protein
MIDVTPAWSQFARAGSLLAASLPRLKGKKRMEVFSVLERSSSVVLELSLGRTIEQAAERLKTTPSDCRRRLARLMALAHPHSFKAGTYNLAPPSTRLKHR